MAIPANFIFSQSNLQDYRECPRRFELRHLKRQRWPAVESEPVMEQERRMQQGERFHQLVQQHQLGLPLQQVQAMITDPELGDWWQNYLDCPPANLPAQRYPEFTLTAAFAGYRVLAKYDLLAVQPGRRAVIVDWKTSRKAQKLSHLEGRMQTRLYPLLLVLAGAGLNDQKPVLPGGVEMIYWFACEPQNPVQIEYSERQFYEDQSELFNLIQEISACRRFDETAVEKTCQYCAYRSLCGRGETAGVRPEEEDEDSGGLAGFDFDQAGELTF